MTEARRSGLPPDITHNPQRGTATGPSFSLTSDKNRRPMLGGFCVYFQSRVRLCIFYKKFIWILAFFVQKT